MLCGSSSVLLPFVIVSLEGSSGDVGALHEEASNEQRIVDRGELLWNVQQGSGEAL